MISCKDAATHRASRFGVMTARASTIAFRSIASTTSLARDTVPTPHRVPLDARPSPPTASVRTARPTLRDRSNPPLASVRETSTSPSTRASDVSSRAPRARTRHRATTARVVHASRDDDRRRRSRRSRAPETSTVASHPSSPSSSSRSIKTTTASHRVASRRTFLIRQRARLVRVRVRRHRSFERVVRCARVPSRPEVVASSKP